MFLCDFPSDLNGISWIGTETSKKGKFAQTTKTKRNHISKWWEILHEFRTRCFRQISLGARLNGVYGRVPASTYVISQNPLLTRFLTDAQSFLTRPDFSLSYLSQYYLAPLRLTNQSFTTSHFPPISFIISVTLCMCHPLAFSLVFPCAIRVGRRRRALTAITQLSEGRENLH